MHAYITQEVGLICRSAILYLVPRRHSNIARGHAAAFHMDIAGASTKHWKSRTEANSGKKVKVSTSVNGPSCARLVKLNGAAASQLLLVRRIFP